MTLSLSLAIMIECFLLHRRWFLSALRRERLEWMQLFFLNVSDTRVTTRFLLTATVFQAEKPAEMNSA